MKKLSNLLIILMFTSCAGMKSSNPIKSTAIYEGPYRRLMNYAAEENTGKMDAVKYESSLDLNYADPVEGVSLLNWCIFNNKPKAFEELLKLGADPNWQDSGGKYATPVIEAAQMAGSDRFLAAALEHNGNPNGRSGKELGSENQTPMLGAVSSGEIKLVKMLVEKGADVNFDADTANNWLPLTDAIVLKHLDIARYLLENGADYRKVQFRRSNNEVLDIWMLLAECNVSDNPAMQKEKEAILAMLQQYKTK